MFKTIICDTEGLKMSKIITGTLPRDSNKSCKCGKILMFGEMVGILPSRDKLGRSVSICLRCKNGKV